MGSGRDQHTCGLCRRHVPRVTRHHLVPRSRARKRKRRGQVEPHAAQVVEPLGPRRAQATELIKGEVRPAAGVTVDLCPACHKMVHAVLSEKESEMKYHSTEALLAHPEILRFVQWVARQPADRHVAVRAARRRR